jgi:hypothetical protein
VRPEPAARLTDTPPATLMYLIRRGILHKTRHTAGP